MRAFNTLLVLMTFGLTTLPAHAELRVVTSVPSLAALAREVGGDRVAVQAMASPREDPHYVDAKPSHLVTLSRADLVIVNGLELEVGWLPGLLTAARNPRIRVGARGYLDASTLVELLEAPTARIDRSMGDVHPGGNPHYLLDARAGARVARGIAARLAELDPDNQAAYRAAGERTAQGLVSFADDARERFAALPAEKRLVVAYHRSLVYLLDWLGLTAVLEVEPKPGIPPNPGHVARVLKTMKSRKARVIVQESFYPKKTSTTLVKLVGGRLAVFPGGADAAAGERFVDYLRAVTQEVYRALQD